MDVPIVTTTLNSPLTVVSIMPSVTASGVLALLSDWYTCSFLMPKLKRSGSLTMKLRYWS